MYDPEDKSTARLANAIFVIAVVAATLNFMLLAKLLLFGS